MNQPSTNRKNIHYTTKINKAISKYKKQQNLQQAQSRKQSLQAAKKPDKQKKNQSAMHNNQEKSKNDPLQLKHQARGKKNMSKPIMKAIKN